MGTESDPNFSFSKFACVWEGTPAPYEYRVAQWDKYKVYLKEYRQFRGTSFLVRCVKVTPDGENPVAEKDFHDEHPARMWGERWLKEQWEEALEEHGVLTDQMVDDLIEEGRSYDSQGQDREALLKGQDGGDQEAQDKEGGAEAAQGDHGLKEATNDEVWDLTKGNDFVVLDPPPLHPDCPFTGDKRPKPKEEKEEEDV